jgi:hypothetical protein
MSRCTSSALLPHVFLPWPTLPHLAQADMVSLRSEHGARKLCRSCRPRAGGVTSNFAGSFEDPCSCTRCGHLRARPHPMRGP